jgi:hypothetical protein
MLLCHPRLLVALGAITVAVTGSSALALPALAVAPGIAAWPVMTVLPASGTPSPPTWRTSSGVAATTPSTAPRGPTFSLAARR